MTNQNEHSIHQEVSFSASPDRVFEALMDEKQHAAFTGGEAAVSRDAGGEFSCHGGGICGRTIEVVANERIVQAWRVGNWDAGVYSMVKIELAPDGDGTKLTLDHTGFPAGSGEHLAGGWHARYWEPLAKYLA